MASARCLRLGMLEEEILEHVDAKCYLYTLRQLVDHCVSRAYTL